MGDRGLVIGTTGLITACPAACLFALEMGKGRGGSSIRLHSHDKKIKALPPACLFSFKKKKKKSPHKGAGGLEKYLTNFFQKWLGVAGQGGAVGGGLR